MTSRPKAWITKLPANVARGVTHRFSIAGRTGAQAPRKSGDPAAATDPGMVSERMRAAMVARIAERGIDDRVVLDAMIAVPRHCFVDAALASRAYEDAALPIGHGQTISQPYIVARMLALMRAGRTIERVLEVGTGCGYQAAVIGQFAPCVVSIERIRALHDLARENLRPLRLASVRLHYGDGREGLPSQAPFDGIVIAAAGLGIPEALLQQVRVGGRIVAPISRGDSGAQKLVIVHRLEQDHWQQRELDDVNFVPLRQGTM